MNFKELAARLLNNEPESWPKKYQDLGNIPKLPKNIDDKINRAIQDAVSESKEDNTNLLNLEKRKNKSKNYRIWATAASLALVTGIGLYIYLNQTYSQTKSGLITIVFGTADLTENFSGNEQKHSTRQLNPANLTKPGIVFTSGSKLQTHTGSAAQIIFSNGIKIRIGSDTKYILLPNQVAEKSPSARLKSRFDSKLLGKMYFESDKLPKDTEFVVHTPTAVATVQGTIYNIEATTNLTTLVVYEGQVEVVATAKENRAVIQKGQRALIDAKGNIIISDLTIGDKAWKSSYDRKDKVFKKYGTGPLNDDLELDSVGAIKKHYGRLYQVILKDGREYTGFPSLHNHLVQVHTTYGVIEIDESDVKSMNELE